MDTEKLFGRMDATTRETGTWANNMEKAGTCRMKVLKSMEYGSKGNVSNGSAKTLSPIRATSLTLIINDINNSYFF